MGEGLSAIAQWLLGPEPAGEERPTHLWPRWIFLRALGLIYFSSFYSLIFQIKGLIGPDGILPAKDYLQLVARYFPGWHRFWFAPTLLWIRSTDHALMLLCWVGLAASVLVLVNLWPRGMLAVCFVCFLSFVSAAQDFSGYQSDGMLLEAGFISLFFAPPGFRPGLGRASAPSRASLFLQQWEWFRIYFESGVAKIASGDPSWRHLTAMDDYYQNGPLPTWIGWYVQHLPHSFHAATTLLALMMELAVVFLLFLPRRFRLACFFIVTPFEIGIILTANYTFLNYLVLSLGFLLLDDRFFEAILPARLRTPVGVNSRVVMSPEKPSEDWHARWLKRLVPIRLSTAAICLGWMFYASSALLVKMIIPGLPLPVSPIRALQPLRIADRYGLFAIMTHERYEIEFQGTRDGKTWLAYPFRYKPQDVRKPPGIYAPYQPRFEWNLWFASLGGWREFPFVIQSEERLLKNDPDVLQLFASNQFSAAPPQMVRTVIWQYWFTDWKTKREEGTWWRRELLGLYAPPLGRDEQGNIGLVPPSAASPDTGAAKLQ